LIEHKTRSLNHVKKLTLLVESTIFNKEL